MNPADKRLGELLDKWLTSLELHLKYATLDEAAYRKVQPWPAHERPSRWIVELALQKVRQLREQHASRIDMGDVKFADALEQMGFLTNLVGSQHIRRFIPLAEPQSEAELPADAFKPHPGKPAANESDSTPTAITPAVQQLEPVDLASDTAERTRISAQRTQPRKTLADEGTREMTQPKIARAKTTGTHKSPAPIRSRTQQRADAERERTVIEDAKRLLGWGRKWHELPELISRMAGRPSIAEVRRILREHKTGIE